MFGYLIAGISFGLSAGFSPGPLFAMVISHTINFGLREGIKAALAPLLTDLPIIFITTFLLSSIYQYKPLLGLISIIGGLFVLYLAYENWRITEANKEINVQESNSVAKGAMVNALSPHPYLFWIMVGSPMILDAYRRGVGHAAIFIVSFYICLVGAKIILAVVVNKSRHFLAGSTYIYSMKALGILLAFFALLLFNDGWKLLVG